MPALLKFIYRAAVKGVLYCKLSDVVALEINTGT